MSDYEKAIEEAFKAAGGEIKFFGSEGFYVIEELIADPRFQEYCIEQWFDRSDGAEIFGDFAGTDVYVRKERPSDG